MLSQVVFTLVIKVCMRHSFPESFRAQRELGGGEGGVGWVVHSDVFFFFHLRPYGVMGYWSNGTNQPRRRYCSDLSCT